MQKIASVLFKCGEDVRDGEYIAFVNARGGIDTYEKSGYLIKKLGKDEVNLIDIGLPGTVMMSFEINRALFDKHRWRMDGYRYISEFNAVIDCKVYLEFIRRKVNLNVIRDLGAQMGNSDANEVRQVLLDKVLKVNAFGMQVGKSETVGIFNVFEALNLFNDLERYVNDAFGIKPSDMEYAQEERDLITLAYSEGAEENLHIEGGFNSLSNEEQLDSLMNDISEQQYGGQGQQYGRQGQMYGGGSNYGGQMFNGGSNYGGQMFNRGVSVPLESSNGYNSQMYSGQRYQGQNVPGAVQVNEKRYVPGRGYQGQGYQGQNVSAYGQNVPAYGQDMQGQGTVQGQDMQGLGQNVQGQGIVQGYGQNVQRQNVQSQENSSNGFSIPENAKLYVDDGSGYGLRELNGISNEQMRAISNYLSNGSFEPNNLQPDNLKQQTEMHRKGNEQIGNEYQYTNGQKIVDEQEVVGEETGQSIIENNDNESISSTRRPNLIEEDFEEQTEEKSNENNSQDLGIMQRRPRLDISKNNSTTEDSSLKSEKKNSTERSQLNEIDKELSELKKQITDGEVMSDEKRELEELKKQVQGNEQSEESEQSEGSEQSQGSDNEIEEKTNLFEEKNEKKEDSVWDRAMPSLETTSIF